MLGRARSSVVETIVPIATGPIRGASRATPNPSPPPARTPYRRRLAGPPYTYTLRVLGWEGGRARTHAPTLALLAPAQQDSAPRRHTRRGPLGPTATRRPCPHRGHLYSASIFGSLTWRLAPARLLTTASHPPPLDCSALPTRCGAFRRKRHAFFVSRPRAPCSVGLDHQSLKQLYQLPRGRSEGPLGPPPTPVRRRHAHRIAGDWLDPQCNLPLIS